MSVTDRDNGFDDLVKLFELQTGEIAVFGGIRSKAGSEMVTIAAVHEFGSPTQGIPARPYLRPTVDRNTEKYVRRLTGVVEAQLDGDRDEALRQANLLGVEAVSDIQKTITELRDPPNAPSTIARKGSSNPLIDTGKLRQSIDYVVVEGPDPEGSP